MKGVHCYRPFYKNGLYVKVRSLGICVEILFLCGEVATGGGGNPSTRHLSWIFKPRSVTGWKEGWRVVRRASLGGRSILSISSIVVNVRQTGKRVEFPVP